jgi:hypothetical protein
MYPNPTPIFIHYLKQLAKMLTKIEGHCAQHPDILHSNLQQDMLPFVAQVRTAANFSLRTCCPLIGRERTQFENGELTFFGLQQQLAETLDYLSALTDSDFEKAPPSIQDKAGFSELNLPREEYVTLYALPNFFFHVSMAYAIARQAGIPLSKGDFDGYHDYPAGFSFV